MTSINEARMEFTIWNSHILTEDILLEIMKRLCISDLYRYRTVCTLWKELITQPLKTHHNRFIARIKLYSNIIAKYDRSDDDDCFQSEIELYSSLREIASDNIIYEKYLSLDMAHNKIQTDNEEQPTNCVTEFHEENSFESYEEDSNEWYCRRQAELPPTTDQCLNGEAYEYDYDDDCSECHINCDMCGQEAFLPIMISTELSTKDHRSDSRYYYSMYGAMCLKCFIKRTSADFEEQPTHCFYPRRTIHPIIGLTCTQLESSVQKLVDSY